MIISQTHKFVFVHVHKTGGTSITASLKPFLDWRDLVIDSTPFGNKLQEVFCPTYGIKKHSTALQMKQFIGPLWDEYYSFSFVRHPYSRALSHYRWVASVYKRRVTLKERLKAFLTGNRIVELRWQSMMAYRETKSFSEYIRHPKFLSDPGGMPQVRWVNDENGKLIVNFIGKTEMLNKHMGIVFQRLGIPAPHIPVMNTSSVCANTKKITDDDYRHLAATYEEDLRQFDYDPALRI